MNKLAVQPFNLVNYAKANKLKLAGTVNLKDESKIYVFSNNKDVACFHLNKDKELLGAKGARGSRPNLFETVAKMLENAKNDIVSITTNVK